jgi:hypothetical protein
MKSENQRSLACCDKRKSVMREQQSLWCVAINHNCKEKMLELRGNAVEGDVVETD